MDGACETLSLSLRIFCRLRGAAEHRGLGGLRVLFRRQRQQQQGEFRRILKLVNVFVVGP